MMMMIYIYIYIYIYMCVCVCVCVCLCLLSELFVCNIILKPAKVNLVCFGLVYRPSNIVGYLMPNSLYTSTLNIYDFIFLWNINYCWLMLNPLYTYIFSIYDLVHLGFMAYQQLFVILCQILFIHIC